MTATSDLRNRPPVTDGRKVSASLAIEKVIVGPAFDQGVTLVAEDRVGGNKPEQGVIPLEARMVSAPSSSTIRSSPAVPSIRPVVPASALRRKTVPAMSNSSMIPVRVAIRMPARPIKSRSLAGLVRSPS
jgi:hypothetical protein